MAIDEKERQEAAVSVTASDPEQPKKKDAQAEENLAKARKELKDNTELVRFLLRAYRGARTEERFVRGRRRRGPPPLHLAPALARLLTPCLTRAQSEEDANLKAELEMLVERLRVSSNPPLQGVAQFPLILSRPSTAQESDSSLHRPALESLRTLIRTSTSSMTSVPKPLKFLRPHYAELQKIQASWPDQPAQSTSAAIASTAAAAVDSVASAVGIKGHANGDAAKQEDQASSASVTDKGLFADILSVLAMTFADTGKRETLMYRLKGGSDEDPGLWGHEYVR